jgi:hypothetical protein
MIVQQRDWNILWGIKFKHFKRLLVDRYISVAILIGIVQCRRSRIKLVCAVQFLLILAMLELLSTHCYTWFNLKLLSTAVFRNPFPPVAHPNLSKTNDGTPQNFSSQKGGTKLYVAINMYLHINSCPIRMQAYKNKT